MRIGNFLFIGLITLAWLSGCKTTKSVAGGKSDRVVKSALEAAKAENLVFESLMISGKAEIDVPAQNLNMVVSYRAQILRDSLMLVRFTKFGFEALRMLVTQDSIYVLNKTNNTYQVSGYGLAAKFTGLDANFSLIQDLLLGNLHLIPEQFNTLHLPNKDWEFKGEKAGTNFTYVLSGEDFKPVSIITDNTTRQQHSSISYEDFKEVSNTQMPQKSRLEVTAPQLFTLGLEHTKVELNPQNLTFSFEIPDGYQRTKVE